MNNREKKDFLITVAVTLKHEIFNPLQAIATSNELLSRQFGQHVGNKNIVDNLLRIKSVVDRLSTMSEIIEDEYPGNIEIIDLTSL